MGASDRSGTTWWRQAVIYQIYPRSFADGNADGTGDLAGVRSRLSYLAALGVDALWFNPWYVSPLADGGYDIADYRQIDPQFGTLAEAEQLIREAAALGLRTIIDIVPNHISDQHPWFQAALRSAPGSPERSRFWFHDGRGPHGADIPTHWVSSFQGETWTRTRGSNGQPGQWYLHLFTPEQPDLNWTHPDVVQAHLEVLRFWFDRGVAGIRIDSAAVIVKDPSFPEADGDPASCPPGQHPYIDRDGIHTIYRGWRAVADAYDPPRILVGEIWLENQERFTAYLRPDEMHTAFNFDFMTRAWSADQFRQSITTTLAAHAGVGAPPTWVLSNHDVTRPVTRYGRADSSFAFAKKQFNTPTDLALGGRRARAAALITAALPGCLYLYQGDELGLPEDEELPRDAIQDPMHFRSGGIDPGRDGCRVPLPWSDDPDTNFGFSAPVRATALGTSGEVSSIGDGSAGGSTESGDASAVAVLGAGDALYIGAASISAAQDRGTIQDRGTAQDTSTASPIQPAWLPQPTWWGTYSVARQEQDPTSCLQLYRRLIALRRQETDLAGAAFAWLDGYPADVLAFRRGQIACVTNLGATALPLPQAFPVIATSGTPTATIDQLEPDMAYWLRLPAVAPTNPAAPPTVTATPVTASAAPTTAQPDSVQSP